MLMTECNFLLRLQLYKAPIAVSFLSYLPFVLFKVIFYNSNCFLFEASVLRRRWLWNNNGNYTQSNEDFAILFLELLTAYGDCDLFNFSLFFFLLNFRGLDKVFPCLPRPLGRTLFWLEFFSYYYFVKKICSVKTVKWLLLKIPFINPSFITKSYPLPCCTPSLHHPL